MVEKTHNNLKYILLILFIFIPIDLSSKESLYSFSDININNEDIDSLKAKNVVIEKTINEKFKELLTILSINSNDLEHILLNHNSQDYLKNIVINKEIVTEKKYIANIDIFFDKEKVLNLYKKNNILFSDTLSPNFLIISMYNFDGSYILWEKNNWNLLWKDFQNIKDQINITLPNDINSNKVLLSNYDITNFNKINLKKILNKYEINNSIIINAKNEYNSNDGRIYINLIITLYDTKNDNLENIFTNKIPIENLNKNTILKDLTFISYDNISKWWKKETVTYFNQINTIVCSISEDNINFVQKVKNKISSITQVDSILLKTLNSENVNFEITFFGDLNELIDIFSLYNLAINTESNKCYLTYGSI